MLRFDRRLLLVEPGSRCKPVPGDVVTARIHRKVTKPDSVSLALAVSPTDYLHAPRLVASSWVVGVESLSSSRIAAPCSHFHACGGCRFQHIPYALELQLKESNVKSALQPLLVSSNAAHHPIIGAVGDHLDILRYRNKMEYSFSNVAPRSNESPSHPLAESTVPAFSLGLHLCGRFDAVVDIEECLLQTPSASVILRGLKREITKMMQSALALGADISTVRQLVADSRRRKGHPERGFLRQAVIRSGTRGEFMLHVITEGDPPECFGSALEVLENLMRPLVHLMSNQGDGSMLVSVVATWGDIKVPRTLLSTRETITQCVGGVEFVIRPLSFFQPNPRQAEILARLVVDAVLPALTELQDTDLVPTVLDLYCGAGFFSIIVAKAVILRGSSRLRVVGIELSADAIGDAVFNATHNGLVVDTGHRENNVSLSFTSLDLNCTKGIDAASKLCLSDSDSGAAFGDIVIVDPPRIGLPLRLAESLRMARPLRIVYVSCNPATFARDAVVLTEGKQYDLVSVQPLDCFPRTAHCEVVGIFQRINP